MTSPRAIIDRVTVTGADNGTSIQEMIDVATEFPFVEWGILFSERRDRNRYPGVEWLNTLKEQFLNLNLSAHICGKWMREIADGRWGLPPEMEAIMKAFDRVQLNFRTYASKIDRPAFLHGLRERLAVTPGVQFIFQLGEFDSDILKEACVTPPHEPAGIDAVAVFDLSGGTGVLPEYWPSSEGRYVGYAGGLSPDNVADQLKVLETHVGEGAGLAWIDAESHLRTDDRFDMQKVRKFLAAAQPWVLQ